ncbi:hypothetical protein BC940DRAFT_337013 [Gongronella butleri]|nr:hypothetical protein BC940DRAFT_337013 [Gongronella butleri]
MTPRFLQSCVFMKIQQRIICHGGTTQSTDVFHNFHPTNDFFQMSVATPQSPNDAAKAWSPMPSVPDFELEARAEFGMAVVNDSRIVIISGAGPTTDYTHSGLANVTVFYDTVSNTFGRYTQSMVPIVYQDTSHGGTGLSTPLELNPITTQLQGVFATSVYPSMNGHENTNTNIFVGSGLRLDNITLMQTSVISNYFLVTSNDTNWNQINIRGIDNPMFKPPSSFRQAGIVTSQDIGFEFCGSEFQFHANSYPNWTDPMYNGTDNSSSAISFVMNVPYSTITGYSTDSSGDPGHSNAEPSSRYWHSVTEVRDDYAYIFDSYGLFWINLTMPQVAANNCTYCPGPLYGHSAVLVNDTIYFMFGANKNHELVNTVSILNVTSLLWLDANVSNSVYNGIGPPPPPSSPSSTGSYLSAGSIAGIVVGVVAVLVITVILAIYLHKWRRRQQAQNVPKAPSLFNQSSSDDLAITAATLDASTANYDKIKPTVASNADEKVKPTAINPEGALGMTIKPSIAQENGDNIHIKPFGHADDAVKPFGSASDDAVKPYFDNNI